MHSCSFGTVHSNTFVMLANAKSRWRVTFDSRVYSSMSQCDSRFKANLKAASHIVSIGSGQLDQSRHPVKTSHHRLQELQPDWTIAASKLVFRSADYR